MNKNKTITIAIISLIGLFTILILVSLLPKKAAAPQQRNAGAPAGGAPVAGGGDPAAGGGSARNAPSGDGAPATGGAPARNAPSGDGAPATGGAPARNAQAGGASSRNAQAGGASSRNASAVRALPVVPDTIERNVIVNGEIMARNQVTIFPAVGGRIIEITRGIGDYVNRGDIVAYIDPSRPGEVYARSPVTSTVAGTIINAPYSIGDTVSAQSGIFTVGDLSALIIETHIAERFTASIALGMRAELWFQAMPGETFAAEVTEINPVLDPSTRTLRIRLRFINPDPRIKAGMFATLSLVTNRKTDVPVIPRVSLINTYGSWIVFLADENNIARRREVTLGLENEEFVEITSGLAIGDIVITAGQNFLSDGDPVRIIE